MNIKYLTFLYVVIILVLVCYIYQRINSIYYLTLKTNEGIEKLNFKISLTDLTKGLKEKGIFDNITVNEVKKVELKKPIPKGWVNVKKSKTIKKK
jgi:hypothetical protein